MSENKPVGHEGRPPLVVTLWETYGSNMEAIAERLAEDLGLPLHKQAYSSEAVEQAEAEREKQGRLGALARQTLESFISPDGLVTPSDASLATNYRVMAQKNTALVQQRAESGGVLQGRNGQYVLHDRPNTVHVKLDGSVEDRVAFAAEASGIGRERAAKRQQLEDNFRVELSHKTYAFDPRDDRWYDLVVNGSKLSTEDAVHLIKEAVRVFTK